MTSATIAFEYKRILTQAARDTGAPEDFTVLQGHDFSFRGMGSRETAAKVGMGHLTSFMGTDTVPAIANVKSIIIPRKKTQLVYLCQLQSIQ